MSAVDVGIGLLDSGSGVTFNEEPRAWYPMDALTASGLDQEPTRPGAAGSKLRRRGPPFHPPRSVHDDVVSPSPRPCLHDPFAT